MAAAEGVLGRFLSIGWRRTALKDLVKPGERIDDLQLNGLRIIQNPEGFCFGIDAVLVSNFCEIRRGDAVVDLGTGTGVIPLLIAGKSGAGHITGFEIQEEVGDMARRSVALNGLEERVSIVTDSFLHAERYLKAGSVQVVVSNPPYVARGAGIHNQGSLKTGSRHEVHCTFEDVAQTASRLLQQGGRFYLVHRPDRLADVIAACRARQLEPKTIRFVQPKPDTAPNLFLMKCVKGGGPELRFMAPLVVYKPDGTYTEEIYDIYRMECIDVFDRR